jgi:hypothetical protein
MESRTCSNSKPETHAVGAKSIMAGATSTSTINTSTRNLKNVISPILKSSNLVTYRT